MWFILALLPLALGVPIPAKPGTTNEYHDILDEGVNEWRLVFRGQSAIGASVYDAYESGLGIPPTVPDACKGVDWKQPCNSHYRNNPAFETEWSNIRDVLFGIVHDGALVKTIRFDGRFSTYMNWFDESRVLDSCYPDLIAGPHNYFSIQGDARFSNGAATLLRRFYINRNYGGCSVDAGWFVALDGPSTTRMCDWEKDVTTYPVFKYTAGITHEKMLDRVLVKNADAIVVFVRYMDTMSVDDYFDLLGTGVKEYRLAFRGTSNVGVPMYPAYLDGTGIPSDVEIGCMKDDWLAECNSHYRNLGVMDNWRHIKEVLVGVIYKGAMIKYLRFHGAQTTNLSFYSRDNLFESCYEDLKNLKASDFNFFSIEGSHQDDNVPVKRRFYINRNYGGCDKDAGWLTVLDTPTTSRRCLWEQNQVYPAIMFAGYPRVQNWEKESIMFADALVFFVKYDYPITTDMLM